MGQATTGEGIRREYTGLGVEDRQVLNKLLHVFKLNFFIYKN